MTEFIAKLRSLFAKDVKFEAVAGNVEDLVDGGCDIPIGVLDIKTKDPWVDIRAYATPADAVAAIGTLKRRLLIPTQQTFNANLAFNANTTVVAYEDAFLVANGVTVTINGKFMAGNYRVKTGNGTLAFGVGSVDKVPPQWWGAKGDGITDDTAAMQTAVDVSVASHSYVLLTPGTYLISSTLNVTVSGTHIVAFDASPIYGPTSGATQLKFSNAGVAVNTWVSPSDSASSPYIRIEGLTINGDNIATVGIDGGYLVHLNYVNIINCTTAGLRIGKVGGFGSGMASYYNHCSFNGNQDGVLFAEGGTQYFSDCIIRQNTRYGVNGSPGPGSSFYKTIIESNIESGINLSGALNMLTFKDCYWEQNDAALVANGYQIRTNITGDSNGIVFDNNIFGSIGLTKIANVTSGRLQFNNCTQVGSYLADQMTVASGQEVVLYRSFEGYPMPEGVKIIPGVQVDPQSALVFTDKLDYIDINSLGITFGAGDFSVSTILEPDRAAVNQRHIFGYENNTFGMILSGSVAGTFDVAINKVGVSYFLTQAIGIAADHPRHIVYSRISSVGYLYDNGVLVASVADANNYSVCQTRIGASVPATPLGIQGKLYACSFFNAGLTADEVIRLWRSGGDVQASGLSSATLDLDFSERSPGSVHERISNTNRSFPGATHWAHSNSDKAPTITVVESEGTGAPATATLSVTTREIDLLCNDPDGCTITLSEVGVRPGDDVLIVNTGTNVCTFSQVAGVQYTTGGGTITLGAYDVIMFRYVTDRWIQSSPYSNNTP